jgi:5-methylcytosine-specific restriction enzyme A
MYMSCSYCNGRHKRGQTCANRPVNNSRKKETNYITRFRSLAVWQKKRHEIKTRDLFLCQYCKKNGRLTFHNLEVHHISPISKDWAKRLDNGNLITLCSTCHKMADNEEIRAAELLEMAKQANALRRV